MPSEACRASEPCERKNEERRDEYYCYAEEPTTNEATSIVVAEGEKRRVLLLSIIKANSLHQQQQVLRLWTDVVRDGKSYGEQGQSHIQADERNYQWTHTEAFVRRNGSVHFLLPTRESRKALMI